MIKMTESYLQTTSLNSAADTLVYQPGKMAMENTRVFSNIGRINDYICRLEHCLACMDASLNKMKECSRILKIKDSSKLRATHSIEPIIEEVYNGQDGCCECQFLGNENGSSMYPCSQIAYSIDKVINLSFPSSSSTSNCPTSSGERPFLREIDDCSNGKPFSPKEKELSLSNKFIVKDSSDSRKENDENQVKRRIFSKINSTLSRSLSTMENENANPQNLASEMHHVTIKKSVSSILTNSEHLINRSSMKSDSQKWNPILINKNEGVDAEDNYYSIHEGLTSVDSVLLLRQKHSVPGRNVSYYNVATSYNERDFKTRGISSVDSLQLAREKRAANKEASETDALASILKVHRSTSHNDEFSKEYKKYEKTDPFSQAISESCSSTNYSNDYSTNLTNDYTYINVVKSHKKETEETVKTKTIYKMHKK